MLVINLRNKIILKKEQLIKSKYKILPIDEVVKDYNALIIDIWGVIYDGYAPYNNAINFLNQMVKDGKSIIFLSNTPRPGTLSDKVFSDWGVDMKKISVYTSGDAVREQLISWNDEIFKNFGRKFYHLGEHRNKDILANLEVNDVKDLKQANFLLMTLYIEEDENINAYDEFFREAISLNLPAVCANPDLTANHGNKIRYCAGTFAQKYKDMGGIVYYYGKPDSRIFNSVLNKYKNIGITDKKSILMIGDTLETDIMGANLVGIDSALVLTGNGQGIAARINAAEQDIFKDCQAKPTWITHGMKE
jgi:HAD superfamily hydrolase (TIGR01459 family)